MKQDLEIVNLKVMLHTNTDEIIELKAGLFVFDKPVSGENLLLCTNYKYNKKLLEYKTLQEKVEIFFNRLKLNEYVEASKPKISITNKKTEDEEEYENITESWIDIVNLYNTNLKKPGEEEWNIAYKTYNGLEKNVSDKMFKTATTEDLEEIMNIIRNGTDSTGTLDVVKTKPQFLNYLRDISRQDPEKNKITRENIIIMLNALFPISFPIPDYVEVLDDNTINVINKIQILFQKEYVYLNIKKPSTVINVTWLNTIQKHPIYYQIYRLIENYQKKILNYLDTINNSDVVEVLRSDITTQQKIDTISNKFRLYNEFKRMISYTEKGTDIEYLEDGKIKKGKVNSVKINKVIDKIESINITTNDGLVDKIIDILPDQIKKKESSFIKNIYLLHYIFGNFKKNTKDYNEFLKDYVEKFVETRDQYSRSSYDYEKKFIESIPELKFHFEFLEDIGNYLPPKRIPTNKKIARALKDENKYSKFIEVYNKSLETDYSGVELVNDGKDYEIQVGISVVGGKVNRTNARFLCNYNSHHLGSLLQKQGFTNSNSVSLYKYIDLENINTENEYNGIINTELSKPKAKVGGKSRRKKYRYKKSKKTRKIYI